MPIEIVYVTMYHLYEKHLSLTHYRNFFSAVFFSAQYLELVFFMTYRTVKQVLTSYSGLPFAPLYPTSWYRKSQVIGSGLYRLTCPCITAANVEVVILTRPQNMFDAESNNIGGREIINHKMYRLTFCSIWNVSPYYYSVFCLTTGPKPLPKRSLHIVRSKASSFKWE